MHHVINALGKSTRRHSMRSRAVRRQQLLHAIVISAIGLAGLAVLAAATLSTSSDPPVAVHTAADLRPTPTSATASMQTPAQPAAVPARHAEVVDAAAEPSPAQPALLDDTAATQHDAAVRADTSGPHVLSLHSLAGGVTQQRPAPRAPQDETVYHPGAQRIIPVNAAGDRLFSFQPDASLTSEALFSLDATTTSGSAAFGTRDVFTADLLNRLPADAALPDPTIPVDELRGIELPQPAELPLEATDPVTRSSIFDVDPDDSHGDTLTGANVVDSQLDSATSTPVQSAAQRPADAGGTVPEPATMPVLLCAWLLVARRRRRPDETSTLRELLRDARSFKLPPGSSDLTLNQIDALRRSRIRIAA